MLETLQTMLETFSTEHHFIYSCLFILIIYTVTYVIMWTGMELWDKMNKLDPELQALVDSSNEFLYAPSRRAR